MLTDLIILFLVGMHYFETVFLETDFLETVFFNLGTFRSSLANFLSRVWTWSDGVKLIHSNSQRRRRLLYFLFIYTKNLPKGIAKHWSGARTSNNPLTSRLCTLRNAHRCFRGTWGHIPHIIIILTKKMHFKVLTLRELPARTSFCKKTKRSRTSE